MMKEEKQPSEAGKAFAREWYRCPVVSGQDMKLALMFDAHVQKAVEAEREAIAVTVERDGCDRECGKLAAGHFYLRTKTIGETAQSHEPQPSASGRSSVYYYTRRRLCHVR